MEDHSKLLVDWLRKMHNSIEYLSDLPKEAHYHHAGEYGLEMPQIRLKSIHLGYTKPEVNLLENKVLYKGIERAIFITGDIPEYDSKHGWYPVTKTVTINMMFDSNPKSCEYPYGGTVIELDENVYSEMSDFAEVLDKMGLSHRDLGCHAEFSEAGQITLYKLDCLFDIEDSSVDSELRKFYELKDKLNYSTMDPKKQYVFAMITIKVILALRKVNHLMNSLIKNTIPT